MKKRLWMLTGILSSCLLINGCGQDDAATTEVESSDEQIAKVEQIVNNVEDRKQETIQVADSTCKIVLNGNTATCDGTGASFTDGVLTIAQAGCYEISGKLDHGRIEVNGPETAEVQIVLNGVDITCENYAPFVVWQADKVVVALADDTENRLADGSEEYEAIGAEEEIPTAVIYSKSDLYFTGNGKLKVQGTCKDGINSKDDLIIQGGSYEIQAADDGLVGKDSVQVAKGDFDITTGGDGIKSSEDTDTEKGYVNINGGQFLITAGDDGIHGESAIVITDGNIEIKESYEGIEAESIIIQDGFIELTAYDDGLNAANGQSEEGMDMRGGFMGDPMESGTGTISIEGGEVFVNADGDGIDSNGSIYVKGGNISVNGPTNDGNGIFDYGGELVVSGGTMAGAGSSGMLQSISENSSQAGMAIALNSYGQAGDEVLVKDSSGKTILSFTPTKTFSAVVVSCGELEVGETYEITVAGNTAATVEQSAISVSNGVGGHGGMGGHGGGPGGRDGMGGPGRKPQQQPGW